MILKPLDLIKLRNDENIFNCKAFRLKLFFLNLLFIEKNMEISGKIKWLDETKTYGNNGFRKEKL